MRSINNTEMKEAITLLRWAASFVRSNAKNLFEENRARMMNRLRKRLEQKEREQENGRT